MRQQKVYVLKLWNDSSCQENWRAALENISNKEITSFASIDDLFTFIQENLGVLVKTD